MHKSIIMTRYKPDVRPLRLYCQMPLTLLVCIGVVPHCLHLSRSLPHQRLHYLLSDLRSVPLTTSSSQNFLTVRRSVVPDTLPSTRKIRHPSPMCPSLRHGVFLVFLQTSSVVSFHLILRSVIVVNERWSSIVPSLDSTPTLTTLD